MNLCIDSQSATLNCQADTFDALVDRLERAGYEPLVKKAASSFAAAFGGDPDELLNGRNEDDDEEKARLSEDTRRRLLSLEKIGYHTGIENLRSLAKMPQLRGEMFYTEDGASLLFVTLLELPHGKGDDSRRESQFRVGFIGDKEDRRHLRDFVQAILKAFQDLSVDGDWSKDDIHNKTFIELATSDVEEGLRPASALSDKEMKAAKALETGSVRELASLVRRSGVMLAKELLRQKAEQPTETIRFVDQLLQSELLHQEYVVVCSKSGSHVNRVDSRDIIEQMAKLGVLCSCGKPIAEEQIEGLLASDDLLAHMLDNNFWMVASVVRLLTSMGVPVDKILINQTAGDDVEMFADVDGTLIMFELKDAEFGMNHTYSLGARIGMHRPQLAFIVSTKGIASEVKEHFKRVKPETQMVYIPNLLQMEPMVKKVIEGVRAMRIRTWMNCFDSLLNFPLAPMMLPKLTTSKFEIPHVVTSVQMQETSDGVPAKSAL